MSSPACTDHTTPQEALLLLLNHRNARAPVTSRHRPTPLYTLAPSTHTKLNTETKSPSLSLLHAENPAVLPLQRPPSTTCDSLKEDLTHMPFGPAT